MIYTSDQFLTYSLKSLNYGDKIANVLSASINAVNPTSAVHTNVTRKDRTLIVGQTTYHLDDYRKFYVVGAGKAVIPMACAITDVLDEYLSEGIIICKEGYIKENTSLPSEKICIVNGGHPLPDPGGIAGTQKIISLLQTTREDDMVICLISGGGSALLTAPVDGVELDHIQTLMSELLKCGATIDEINVIRKHLETIKGGGLTRYAYPAQIISLILSDVIDDRLDVIASGPTAPDPSTFTDAYSILEKYDLSCQVPASVIEHLQDGLNGKVEETPKPGDPIFYRTQNLIIGSNRIAAHAAIKQAKLDGFNTILLTTYLQGQARFAGEFLACIAKQMSSNYPPVDTPSCLISGGETTVVVRGTGMGGRNTELALGAVNLMRGLSRAVLISLATDGGDGFTDAAGAIVTGNTYERAALMNMYPSDYLKNNDSYNYFSSLDDLLKPGPTSTNVNDLIFIFTM